MKIGDENMNELTVIVAVYNTAKYLEQCLDSIFGQSYKNFDVLLLDDCSTDGSGEICEQYKEKYSERSVTVLHNEVNRGISWSRERAVSYVQTEWVYFVDSDDIIHPDLIKMLMDIVTKPIGSNIDIFEVNQVSLNDRQIKEYKWKKIESPRIMVKSGGLTINEKVDINDGLGLSKNLIRRTLFFEVDYLKYKEKWPRRFFNDGLYTSLLYQKANTIALLEDEVYLHRDRANSTGRVLDRIDHIRDWIETDEEMYRIFRESGEDEFANNVITGMLDSITKLVYMIDTRETNEKKLRKRMYDKFKKYYKLLLSTPQYRKCSILRRLSWRIFNCNSSVWGKTIGYLWFEKIRDRRTL